MEQCCFLTNRSMAKKSSKQPPPHAVRNLYDVIGVGMEATSAEIKRAYKKRALKLHPDKVGPALIDQFIELQEAYEILSNSSTREQYDSCDSTLLTAIARRRKERKERWLKEQEAKEQECRATTEWLFQDLADEIEVDERMEARDENIERENRRREWKEKERAQMQKQQAMLERMMADTLKLREHSLDKAHGDVQY